MKHLFLAIIILFSNFYAFSLKTINIYPNSIKQNSGLYIKKGEIVEISVNGKWSLHEKYSPVGGEGHNVFKANEYGNWGCLLGKIGNSDIFIIGNGTQIAAKDEGVLYLFPNKDNYKIQNPTGFLEVSVNGGTDLNAFKTELEKNSSKFIYNTNDDFLITDLFVNKGDELKIYAFEYWTMWNNYYPEVTAEGHNFVINSVNFGKLYAGIGSTFNDFLEVFPIGEHNIITVQKSGILSFFPFINNYKTDKSCKLEIYVTGGKKASETDKLNSDLLLMKIKENELLLKINEFRTLSKLPELQINTTLSETAFNHAKYLITNNLFTRDEISSNLFFTGETLEARLKNKNFTSLSYEMICETNYDADLIQLFINTVYHRLKLQDPNLKYIGYGYYKKNKRIIHVLDLAYIDNKELNFSWDMITYPPNNYTVTQASWSGNESPDPLPPNTNKPLGSPVSIIFNKKIIKIINSELLNDQNNSVSCFVINSATDINNKNINGIILVPKVVLNYNTKYTAKIRVLFENNEEKEYVWSFITEQQK